MRDDRLRAALAPVAGGVMAAAFPDPAWPWLVAPGLAGFFALAVSATPRRAFKEGFVFGVTLFAVMLRWFSHAILAHSSLGVSIAVIAVVAAATLLALLTGFVAALLARVSKTYGPGLALLAGPAAWVGLESAREVIPFPFPWGVLSTVFAATTWAPPVATVIGSTGLSLLLAALSASIAALITPGIARRSALIALAVVGTGGAGCGWLGVAIHSWRAPGPTLRFAALQGALERDATVGLEYQTYVRLTEEAARGGAKVIVWPESAVSYLADENATFRDALERLADRFDVDLVVGSLTRKGENYQNSAVLIRPRVGLFGIAAKRQLVPFGEYMPLRWLLGRIPALAAEVIDLIPGDRAVTLPAGAARVGALICYEAVFPGLALGAADNGADVLINLTNDAWFGFSGGPHQHMNHTLLRAAETGRPLLRAANTGISVAVDRRGQVVARLPLEQQGILLADLELGTSLPPGGRMGRILALGCVISLVLLVALSFLPRRAPPVFESGTVERNDSDAR